MKAKKLKSGRKVLMPEYSRRLRSFRLFQISENFVITDLINHINRLTEIIDGVVEEKKPPVIRG